MPLIAPSHAVKAGELRHEAELQFGTRVRDSIGGREITYTTYATVPVSVRDLPFVVSEDNATVLRLVGLRYRSDVKVGHRVVVAGLTLKVLAKENPDHRNRRLILHCAEVEA